MRGKLWIGKLGVRSRYGETSVPSDTELTYSGFPLLSLSLILANRYRELLNRTYVDDNETLRWCPYPNCPNAIFTQDYMKQNRDVVIPIVKCDCVTEVKDGKGEVMLDSEGKNQVERNVFCFG